MNFHVEALVASAAARQLLELLPGIVNVIIITSNTIVMSIIIAISMNGLSISIVFVVSVSVSDSVSVKC